MLFRVEQTDRKKHSQSLLLCKFMRIVNMERKLIYFAPIFLSMVSMTAASCYDTYYDSYYECKLMTQIQLFVAAFWIAALAVNYIITFLLNHNQ